MTLQGKLALLGGHLCVVYSTTFENEPLKQTTWWRVTTSTGNPYTTDWPKENDLADYLSNNGTWCTRDADSNRSTGSVRTNGEVAERVTTEPVPEPKVRRNLLRWYQGRWQKLLKRGWVDA